MAAIILTVPLALGLNLAPNGTLTFTDFALNNGTLLASEAVTIHVFDTTGVTYIGALTGTTTAGADLALLSPLLTAGVTYEGWFRFGSGPRGAFRLTAT